MGTGSGPRSFGKTNRSHDARNGETFRCDLRSVARSVEINGITIREDPLRLPSRPEADRTALTRSPGTRFETIPESQRNGNSSFQNRPVLPLEHTGMRHTGFDRLPQSEADSNSEG